MAEQLRDHLRFVRAALFRDGGEYGIWGAMSGGILWACVLVAVIAILARLGVLH